jgi:acetyl esterase/lipase
LKTLVAAMLAAAAGLAGAAAPPAVAPRAVLPIWPGVAPGSEHASQQETTSPFPGGKFTVIRNIVRPTLTVYLPEHGLATTTGVIIAPGGAFRFVNFEVEGTEVARWLVARGIAAFVLKYRVVETSSSDVLMWADVMIRMANPEPLIAALGETGRFAVADGMQAMKVVRAHAKEWGVAENRIGFVGFSAGAMVASRVLLGSAQADRPAFAAPIYGAPFGEMSPIPERLPPVFLAYASDDGLVSRHVDAFYAALRKAGLHPELHVYDRGGHGFGMTRQGTSSDYWIEDFYHWLESHGLTSPRTATCGADSPCSRDH